MKAMTMNLIRKRKNAPKPTDTPIYSALSAAFAAKGIQPPTTATPALAQAEK